MRYLVFGDVHANLTALEAALEAGRKRGAEGYLFVGDLIGYGPEPLECIERLMPLQERGNLAWVAGNHELLVRGEVDPTGYSEEALETLEWTKALLERNPRAKEFVESAMLAVCANGLIWLAHDSLAEPGSGGYHRSPRNAKSELACLRFNKGRVCFYGHTHTMRAELHGGSGVMLAPMPAQAGDGLDPRPLRLKEGELGWIGAGSVGLPTNRERRAEFLILDDGDPAAWAVEKYEVEYSRETARAHVRAILGKECSQPIVEQICRWL
jgi:predicted phosphodiesterase